MFRSRRPGKTHRRTSTVHLNIEPLEHRALLSLTLIKDINPAPAFPAETTNVGGTLYFTTRAANGGTNLDKLTATGVTVLKNFTVPLNGPGSPYSYGSTPAISDLTAAGSNLFFVANGGNGPALWVTNGTAAGTRQLSDVDGTEPVTQIDHLTAVGSRLFFTAYDPKYMGTPSLALFESDGTPATTHPVGVSGLPGNLNQPIALFGPGDIDLAAFKGKLYFANGIQLSVTDGSTHLPDSIGQGFTSVNGLTAAGGKLFFIAHNNDGTEALWATDGQFSGVVKTFPPTAAPGVSAPPLAVGTIVAVGSRVFFTEADPTSPPALWESDGTSAGTKLVKSFPNAQSLFQVLYNPTAVGGKLFFTRNAASPSDGFRLWVSDGTAKGTKNLSPFALPPTHAYFAVGNVPPQSAVKLAAYRGVLYYANDDPLHGVELWRSDGTVAGTKRLADINPGAGSSFPSNLAVSGGTLYFSASSTKGSNQLWKLEAKGNPAKVASFTPAATIDGLGEAVTDSAVVSNAHGTAMIFAADDGVHGSQLWRTDGTTAGTYLIKNFAGLGRNVGTPGPWSFGAARFTTVGGLVYFVTGTSAGENLWVTDGTTAGTKQVQIPEAPGTTIRGVVQLTPFNGGLTFVTVDGSYQGPFGNAHLWFVNASTGNFGATDIKDFTSLTSVFGSMAVFNGKLYFGATQTAPTAANPYPSAALWSSDGTTAGTTQVLPDTVLTDPSNWTVFDGQLYFTGNIEPRSFANQSAWVSDGTAAGTRAIFTPPTSSSLNSLVATANGLIAMGGGSISGSSVPSVDLYLIGTGTQSTQRIAQVAGYNWWGPPPIVLPDGKFFFSVQSPGTLPIGSTAGQPWVSDGTAGGTVMLKDINANFVVTPSFVWNDKLYFAGSDAAHGNELWVTDGTPDGTTLYQDINHGQPSSNPSLVTSLNGNLIVAADDGLHGLELLSSGRVAPKRPTLPALPSRTVLADHLLQFQVAASPGTPGDTLVYSLAPGSPAGAVIDPSSGRFTWTPPTPRSASFSVVVTEYLGSLALTSTAHFTVTVKGAAPTVSAGSPASVGVNRTFIRTGSVSSPSYETLTAIVDYGDGTPRSSLLLKDGKFTLHHVFKRTGPFTITMTARDQYGDVGTARLRVTVTK